MTELNDIFEHPLVQELIDQNEILSDSLSERQMLSAKKRMANLDKIKLPLVVKDRILFKEGTHNGLFYPFDTLSTDSVIEQFDGLDLFMAEHADASNSWVGVIRNPRANNSDRTIRGDLEIVDKSTAQKVAYMLHNKTASMGLSPTVDVDKRIIEGRAVALDPKFVSESFVLKPAVRETVFNSEKGGRNMQLENMSDEDKKQVESLMALDSTQRSEILENLTKNKGANAELKEQHAELEKTHTTAMEKLKVLEAEKLTREVEPLAQLEIDIGRIEENKKDDRVKELSEMTEGERKLLSESYDWVKETLELDADEDTDTDAGNAPPDGEDAEDNSRENNASFIKFRTDFLKKNKGASMAQVKKAWAASKGKKNLALDPKLLDPKLKGKKYPYPEKQSIQSDGQKSRQEMSERYDLVENREQPLNRFNLSQEQIDGNKQFLEFLHKQQGGL